MKRVGRGRGRMGPFVALGVLVAASLVVVPGSAGATPHESLENAISYLKTAIGYEEHAEQSEYRGYHDAAEDQLKNAARYLDSADKDLGSVDLVSEDAPVLSDIARAEKIDKEKDLRDGQLVTRVRIAVTLKKRALEALQDLAGEPAAPPPTSPAPFTISRIKAVFVPQKFETVYTVDVTKRPFEKTLPKLTASWTLKISCIDPGCGKKQGTEASPAPNEDPGCNNADVGVAKPFEQELSPTEGAPFIWHHPSPGVIPPYHCDHSKQGPSGHQGLIAVKVEGDGWTCSAQLGGTESYDPETNSIQSGEARKATAPVCSK